MPFWLLASNALAQRSENWQLRRGRWPRRLLLICRKCLRDLLRLRPLHMSAIDTNTW